MGTHRCFGNYEPGKNCRACIEQKKCMESMSKKKPGRPKKEKAEEKSAETEKPSEGDPSESLL